MWRQVQQRDVIVGLDIGTTKICVVVGKFIDGKISIIGAGVQPSIGLRKGVVVNIEATAESIKKAVEDAKLMAGCGISSVYASISGGHIACLDSCGIVDVKGNTVVRGDVARAIDAAKTAKIPEDHKVLHVLFQEYLVDGQIGIHDPIGMAGARLDAKIHIITGAVASIDNIVKCVNRAGLDICDIVLGSLASGESVLTNEEKELGTALIDLGGGTSDLVIFEKQKVRHTFVLPLGGDNLTNDLAIGIRTSLRDAEKIKKQFGICSSNFSNLNGTVEVQRVGEDAFEQIPRQFLGEILCPRMEEIFYLISRELCQAKIKSSMISGIVLSGGTSLIAGVVDVAKSIFGVPVHIGSSTMEDTLADVPNNPIYATGVGLVIYGVNGISEKAVKQKNKKTFTRLMTRMKKWFVGIA